MSRNDLGKVRRSQVITQAGPGAIVDFRSERGAVSVVAGGLELWDPGLEIHESRLEKKLGVSRFHAAPVCLDESTREVLKAVRFPIWQQCPRCHLLASKGWGRISGEPAQYCPSCSPNPKNAVFLIPAPFVRACERGHLDEFPWDIWIDHKEGCPKGGKYELNSTGQPGLAGLSLKCRDCGERRSLEGSFGKDSLARYGACRGLRPWLPQGSNETCTLTPQAMQRGASNGYFPVIASALDIPPWSDALQKRLAKYWDDLVKATEPKVREIISALNLDQKLGMEKDQLFREVMQRKRLLEGASTEELRYDEYKQLTSDAGLTHDEASDFEIRPENVPIEARDWISRLVRVVRLREVRVLRAFTRLRYPDPEQAGLALPEWARISAQPKEWLPGVEVRGEGIFLELNSERVNSWSDTFKRRAKRIHDAFEAEWTKRHPDLPLAREISPKFLLGHSLAHALIRQLSLECGYAAASLRERLYLDGDCSGILIYTAAPDSDGTLGGLAREGRENRFRNTLQGALKSQQWCASDPLCLMGTHSFSEHATGAACHACMLVSETSCEEFNRVLDRQTLAGAPDGSATSYFAGCTLLA